jgi:lipopolysaccharide heptosyltransferase II
MSTAAQWQRARNVLCVRLDSLGDVLMCTPAVRAIKQSHPERCITLLTSPGAVAATPFIPEIDAVISYAAPWTGNSEAHAAEADLTLAQALRSRRFDAAIIFTSYRQSALPAALLCHLAGIPLRLAHCRENPHHLLSDWIADPEPQQLVKHEVRRQLDLVAGVGYRTSNEKMSFAVQQTDLAWVRRRLGIAGVDAHRPWILLHTGARAASRRYPPEHWVQVMRALASTPGHDMVLTGQEDDVPMIDALRRACGAKAHSLAGELDVGQLGAAIALAALVISNNTGPAHMAAAIGTPLVDIYALTDPQHTPWQVENRLLFHDVPCRFCHDSVCPQRHHDCLNKIDPSRVVQAVHSLLADPA